MPKKIEKEPTEGNYTTIKLPNDLVVSIDKLIGKHGFRSRAEIVKDALRELLSQYKTAEIEMPRFEHFNVGPDGVRITERKLNSLAVADIYFKPEGIFCELDQSDHCEHIDFALKIPEIQAIIRKKRKEHWKLPDV